MGEPARSEHGLRRAAAPLPVGALVGPQLQRHRDHLRAALALEPCSNGAVDAAAQRDEDPVGPRPVVCRDERGARANGRGESSV